MVLLVEMSYASNERAVNPCGFGADAPPEGQPAAPPKFAPAGLTPPHTAAGREVEGRSGQHL